MIRIAAVFALCGLAACGSKVEQAGASPNDTVTAPDTPVPAAEAQDSAGGVDCLPSEDRVFSCKARSGKRIAVCGTDTGKVEYRFGGDKPEIVMTGGEFAAVPYSGGGEAQIKFDKGDTSYIVFSRMIRINFAAGEPNYPAISDGVIVLRIDKVAVTMVCDDPDVQPIDYDTAAKHMAKQNELFTYETALADPPAGRQSNK